MRKQDFIKHMKSIKEMQDAEEKITKALQLVGCDDLPTYFSLTKPIDCMMDILADAMDDHFGHISYFVYDLGWGKEPMAKGCITDKNGKKISLQTERQLYDFIKSI